MFKDSDLAAARDAGLITQDQYEQVIRFLDSKRKNPGPAVKPKFDLTHVLWYAGAVLIMAAMGLFSNDAFNRMGGWALVATGCIYAFVSTAAGYYLWHRKGLHTPGGLLAAVAVSMVPLIIYGIQDAFDLWRYALGDPGQYNNFFPFVNGSWLYMELGTIAAAVVVLRYFPFPFILLIAGIALWFMSMDLAMWFTSTPGAYDEFEIRQRVTIWFGAAMIVVAWAIDLFRGSRPDFGFWLHIFGILAFWGGITAYGDGTELQGAIYCAINVALIGLGIFLDRRVYAIAGTLGIATYLGHLAFKVFQDVMVFSFALSAIGIFVIALGLLLNKNYQAIAAAFDAVLPTPLKRLRPVSTGVET